MKIAIVVGARPQFIKYSMLSHVLRKRERGDVPIQPLVIHTGQHYDKNMSEIFFDELGIDPPHLNLEVGSGLHSAQTGRMLIALEKAYLDEKPDLVLVYGDTNSTLAGALAAAKLLIPVAHVEAGLRSFNSKMPEEINRVLTDHCSTLLFAPTQGAVDHLKREGIPDHRIHLVGDVMYDVALHFADRAEKQSAFIEKLGLIPGEFILATLHRQENTDDPARLANILTALAMLSSILPVVLPLHPRTRAVLGRRPDFTPFVEKLKIVDPLGYLNLMMMEKHSKLVITDSGGIQKEAFFHRTPVVTVRDETEWVELLDLGWNRLAPPTSPENIFNAAIAMMGAKGTESQPYGDGRATEKILEILLGFLSIP